MRSFCKRVCSDCVSPRDVILVAAEALCLVVFVSAIIAGTAAEFTFPRQVTPNGCYFTDALIVYIACRQQWLGQMLSWAWWWTWGIGWQIGFLPFSLVTLIPQLVMIWLAGRFVRRLAV